MTNPIPVRLIYQHNTTERFHSTSTDFHHAKSFLYTFGIQQWDMMFANGETVSSTRTVPIDPQTVRVPPSLVPAELPPHDDNAVREYVILVTDNDAADAKLVFNNAITHELAFEVLRQATNVRRLDMLVYIDKVPHSVQRFLRGPNGKVYQSNVKRKD